MSDLHIMFLIIAAPVALVASLWTARRGARLVRLLWKLCGRRFNHLGNRCVTPEMLECQARRTIPVALVALIALAYLAAFWWGEGGLS